MPQNFYELVGEMRGEDNQTRLRHVALVLHGHTVADRQWLLARLTDQQRAELEPLVAELAALNLNPHVSRLAVQQQRKNHRISSEHVKRLSIELSQEPPTLVSAVLKIGAKTFGNELIKALAVESSGLHHEMNQPPLPHALLESLNRRLSRTAAEPSALSVEETPQPASKALIRRLYSILRKMVY